MSALAGQRVVVIGGSSGIGLAVARLAAAAGATLLVTGRDPDRLATAANSIPGGAESARLDAHDETVLTRFFDVLGPCDHLVSMVGDAMSGGFLGCDMARLGHVIDSKFLTNVRIARLARKLLRPGGSLVFTSAAGGKPQSASGAYVGSLAIDAMVEGLAVEMAPHLRVNVVAPTFTETGMWAALDPDQLQAIRSRFIERIPLARLAMLDEVAGVYIFLMENGFVTGQRIAVDGGMRLVA
jgi:NAD(P)-dependent dehydrogenase (short-subunit alcohol dehydrogenase family)